jgi:hypothetical protein
MAKAYRALGWRFYAAVKRVGFSRVITMVCS